MVGVILAAGDGKRLKNSSNEDCCKPLIKIKGKRLVEYALDNLMQLKINEAYIVIGKEGDLIKRTVGNQYENIKVHYIYQQEQKGLMDAFAQAAKILDVDEHIVLQLSDELFIDFKTEEILSTIKTEKFDFYCGVTFEDDPEKIKNNYSVEVEKDFVIKKCTEKPLSVINDIKGTGFCVFNAKCLKTLKKLHGVSTERQYDLCDYINLLVSENKKGTTMCVAEKEFNINTTADLIEAMKYCTL